jgi:hypothetical protein
MQNQRITNLGRTETRGAFYCFNLAQAIFAQDDTGMMRVAASVGDGPLYVKFMKSEEAAESVRSPISSR